MDAKTSFERLFAHAAWANSRLASALRATPRLAPEVVRLFAHLLTAERIYLERIRGLDPWPQNFWPEMSLAACETLATANGEDYAKFLAALDAAQLDTTISYRNSKGERYETPLVDMLSHVATHGAYHRGQIAAAVRRAGADPVDTDLITFSRRRR